jgi:hypothetical protein
MPVRIRLLLKFIVNNETATQCDKSKRDKLGDIANISVQVSLF